MKKPKAPEPLTDSELERVSKDLHLRETIGWKIMTDENTIYQWAKYRPHLFSPDAISHVRKYIAKHPTAVEQEA